MWFSGRSKQKKPALNEKEKLPIHIAIFMDGNRRWAARRGLPPSAGHREGANTLKRIVRICNDIGIKYMTVYALSTENWNRPKDQVDALMTLFIEFLRNADDELSGQNIRIKIIGESYRLSDEILKQMARVTANTKNNTGLTLVVALNYGSRTEIVNAAVRLSKDVKKGLVKPEEVDETLFSNYLYTAGIPDPDLVIRPSGEYRISNFLLWQSSYSEFWYSNILWPDFSRKDLITAIEDFQKRNRRFGGL
ncbi:MAG: isoprenyl transferase [Clostridiaceae bacterium]